MRCFLVPLADCKIDQSSWHVEGLQGTGSKDIDVDSFVPEYRTQTVEQVYKGIEPGKAVNKSPIFQIPWFTMWSFGLAAPAIGTALGALQAYVDDNRTRASALLGKNVSENSYVHTRLVEAATAINDAKARIPVTWNHIYDVVTSGSSVSTELRIQTRFHGSYTVKQCLEAVIRLFEVSGGAGVGVGQATAASYARSHGDETASIRNMGEHGCAIFFSSVWASGRSSIFKSSSRMYLLVGRAART